MALCNFDFESLAARYDRILNATRAVQSPENVSHPSRQVQVFHALVSTISCIFEAYEIPFQIGLKQYAWRKMVNKNSCAFNFWPGQNQWSDNDLTTNIQLQNANDSFYGSIMSLLKSAPRTAIVDSRRHGASLAFAT
jgi:hypothetical protein